MNEDKRLTFVVPVYGVSGLYLNRCLNSLLDNQDYPNKDVIVVYDGNKKEEQMQSALGQQEEFKEDKRVQFFIIEHGGAPKARNFGLSKATGDYICFFDCDSILLAGGLRTWIQAFEEHPDCGFIYGSYRFMISDANKQLPDGIPAQPFDEYLLTCNNYIDTKNPIKRELCPQWDENLSALQDWDFWLQVAKKGIKGHMIPEWVVQTEEPDDESITGKAHKNHLENFNTVRNKYNIKRDKAISSFGARFQGIRRAKILNADYRDPQMLLFKPHDYKAVISMGYYIESQPYGAYAIFANCQKDCKKIIHFIGTDVAQLWNLKVRDHKYLIKELPKAVDKIFANAPWLVEELKELGIESELLYCPVDPTHYQIRPFPEKFTVAFYWDEFNKMHNEGYMIDVARSMPDVQFKFFGGKTMFGTDIPKNIENCGKIKEEDMPEFIASTSMIIRLTSHDGFPATIAEWVMSGRPFVSNLKDMPFNRHLDVNPNEETYVEDKEKTIKVLRRLQKKITENNDDLFKKDLNIAREHYIKLLDPQKYIKRMNEVINEKK